MLGVTPAGLSDLALKAEAGAGGLVLLPYLDGERTPNRPAANGVLRGLTTSNATPENLARAAVEAVLCSLADAVDCLRPCGITPARIVLTGGAARSEAVRTIAPAVFGLPVAVPEAAEYVALGAARQAAWALSGAAAAAGLGGAAVGDPRGERDPWGPGAVRGAPRRRGGLAGALAACSPAQAASAAQAPTAHAAAG